MCGHICSFVKELKAAGGDGSEYDFVFPGIYCDSFLPITVSYVDKDPTLDSDHCLLLISGLLLDKNCVLFTLIHQTQRRKLHQQTNHDVILPSFPFQMKARNYNTI